MNISVKDQRVPAHYLNRHFAISFNLPKLAPLADADKSFPAVNGQAALALAAVALARLTSSLALQAQASNVEHVGSTAAYVTEVTAAKAEAADALAAVKAAYPNFSTSDDVIAALTAYEAANGAGTIRHFAVLPVNWARATYVEPLYPLRDPA